MNFLSRFFQSTWTIMLIAVVVRSAVLIIGAGSLQDDPDAYARLAVNLAESGVLGFEDPADGRVEPSAFRPPLYPLLLSLVVSGGDCSRLGVAVLHLLLGTLSVWLVLSIARSLQLRWAPVAAMAFAVDPLLLRASQLVMTETLATFLALAAWRLWLALPLGSGDGFPFRNGVRQVQPPPSSPQPDLHGDTQPPHAIGDTPLSHRTPDGDTHHSRPATRAGLRGDTANLNGDTPELNGDIALSGTPIGNSGSPGDTRQSPSQQVRQAGETGRRGWKVVAVSLGLGLVLGLSILCRPTAAPWALLCVMALAAWKFPCRSVPSSRCRLAVIAVVLAGVVVNVGSWTWRNWAELGAPIWATTHGGYTLLLANNPSLYQHFAEHGPSRNWRAEPFHAAWAARGQHRPAALLEESYWLREREGTEEKIGWSELENDRAAYSAARATIERNPGMFLLSSLYRISWLWAWWPNTERLPVVLAIGSWYGVWSLAAIFALVWRPQGLWLWGWIPIFLLAFSLTAVHSVYWSNMRMRCPVVAGVYLLAIAGGGQRIVPPGTKPGSVVPR